MVALGPVVAGVWWWWWGAQGRTEGPVVAGVWGGPQGPRVERVEQQGPVQAGVEEHGT